MIIEVSREEEETQSSARAPSEQGDNFSNRASKFGTIDKRIVVLYIKIEKYNLEKIL